MQPFPHDGVLFVSLNPAEHVAVTLPGSMLDELYKAGQTTDEQFVFFANKEGSLLRIGPEEYAILKKFTPRSPFDEQLKRLASEYYLAQA